MRRVLSGAVCHSLGPRVAQGCGAAGNSPPAGTLYWALLRVWDDGTHEFVIPAINDASGCGDDLESARQDVREKLACQVRDSVAKGLPLAVLTKRQTALKLGDYMSVIAEECEHLGLAMPELKKSEMIQIDLDYTLIVN